MVFNKLDRNALLEIVNIELAGLEKRLKARGLELEISDDVRNYLLDQGFEPEFGARPLRRSIERFIEDPLAEELLRGVFADAAGIRVECDRQKILFFPVKAAKKRRTGKRSK